MAGGPVVAGDLSAAEAGRDTFGVSGGVTVSGALSAAETGAETASMTGTVGEPPITGTMAANDNAGPDLFAGAGAIISTITGTFAALETGDDCFKGRARRLRFRRRA